MPPPGGLPIGRRKPREKTFEIENEVSNSIFDVIRTAGEKADHILIGDTDHTCEPVRDFLCSEDLMKALAEAGCMHVCIEFPTQLDEHVQKYYDGEYTREEFLRRMRFPFQLINDGDVSEREFLEGIMDTVDHAKKYGMEVHCVDIQAGTREIQIATRNLEKAKQLIETTFFPVQLYEQSTGIEIDKDSSPAEIQAFQEFCAELDQQLFDRYAEETGIELSATSSRAELQTFGEYIREHEFLEDLGYDTDQIERRVERILDHYRDELDDAVARRTRDNALHDHIEDVTNGEKFALIYGASHDRIAMHLRGCFGLGGSNLVIDICEGNDDVQRIQDSDHPNATHAGQPDFVHVIDDDKTYETDSASRESTEGLDMQRSNGPPREEVDTVSQAPEDILKGITPTA